MGVMAALKKQQHIERLRASTKKLGDAPKLPKGVPTPSSRTNERCPTSRLCSGSAAVRPRLNPASSTAPHLHPFNRDSGSVVPEEFEP